MAKIDAEEPVRCPPAVAAKLLERAIRAIADGEKLTVRVRREAGGGGVAFERNVRFRVAHERDTSRLNEVVTIVWDRQRGIPLPALPPP